MNALVRFFLVITVLPVFMNESKEVDQVQHLVKKPEQEKHIRLDDQLLEISGIIPFQRGYLALNDGGPDTHLYVLDSVGRIKRKIYVATENNDWEALTSGDGHIYIGDVGNNFGTRVNLRVIEIDLDDLNKDTLRSDDLNVITFKTPWTSEWIDQGKHDKDCEAMVYRSNRIHFFSKNRLSDEVVHLALDLKNRDSIRFDLLETTTIKGQVTDACFDSDGALLLLGYKAPLFKTFVVRFSPTGDGFFFNSERSIHQIGSFLTHGQSEAICISNEGELIIGCEGNRCLNRSPRLHYLSAQKRF